MSDVCVVCDEQRADHSHHRKMRSQGGSDESANLLRVCLGCHAWIHANPSDAYARGLLVHSWADPANVRTFLASETERVDEAALRAHLAEKDAAYETTFIPIDPAAIQEHLEPGHECPTCKRRVPHPKKASSPTTKVWSTRVPVADAETFSELVDAAAEHHGLSSKAHHRFWTLNYALVLLLQAEKGDLPV